MYAHELISTYAVISDQIEVNELLVILTSLETILNKDIAGSVVEFGCYVGTTSLFIQRLLLKYQRAQSFHVYDSFEGLPEKHDIDMSAAGTQFKAGELAASKAEFIKNFRKAGLPLPHIHKGWFESLTSNDIPKQICFAFLDGDYYESILTPLQLIWPHLSPGAVLIVDDYHNQALPGAAKAVDEWLKMHPVKSIRVQASLVILHV
jgi:O-methyltransferase